MVVKSLILGCAFFAATLVSSVAAANEPVISVSDATEGGYVVVARFTVDGAAAIAREVLTDYPNIPRFMPDVRSSEVLDRQDGSVLVEQAAVSKWMLFSKKVHLILDVSEGADVIRFRDRCKKSFTRYEGAWTIRDEGDYTTVTYELNAQPAFSVPEFVVRKLLDRDARVMIERLREEISSRAAAR